MNNATVLIRGVRRNCGAGFVRQVLEMRARELTCDAIRALLDLALKTARRIKEEGTESDVPLDSVVASDRLRVRPGEPMPVKIGSGDAVTGATINKNGSLVIEASKVGSDITLLIVSTWIKVKIKASDTPASMELHATGLAQDALRE